LYFSFVHKRFNKVFALLLFCNATLLCAAQQTDTVNRNRDTAFGSANSIAVDSLGKAAMPVTDAQVDSIIKKHSPRKAAIRSAIIPGWGQVYNKKYWKLPLVYGALGTTAVVFKFNLDWYRRTRFAYQVAATRDTTKFSLVHPDLRRFVDGTFSGGLGSLQNARDNYRRSVDYSVLFFIVFWGLNVVDATVDAHLKAFDVSPDLSLKLKAGYSELSGTNGIGLVLSFK
jgi:hypothetical protein